MELGLNLSNEKMKATLLLSFEQTHSNVEASVECEICQLPAAAPLGSLSQLLIHLLLRIPLQTVANWQLDCHLTVITALPFWPR